MPIIQLRPARKAGQPMYRTQHGTLISAAQVQQRVAALQAMAVLDTPPEEGFDALTRLAASVFDAPIALVSLIDGARLWFKASYGVEASECDSRHSFCSEAADSQSVLEVESARLDPRFADNSLVTGALAIQYYAGAPILHRGIAIGTVCVLDYTPRKASVQSLYALQEMANIATVMMTGRIDAFRMFSSS